MASLDSNRSGNNKMMINTDSCSDLQDGYAMLPLENTGLKFHERSFRKVSKLLVHKDQDDDVLLCNGRGALPLSFQIDISQYESLEEENLGAVLDYYYEISSAKNLQSRAFCLIGIPWRLHSSDDQIDELNSKAPHLLDICYSKVDGEFRYVESIIGEEVQDELVSVLQGKPLSDYDRYRASMALDNLIGVVRPRIYKCVAYNDTGHYYFYRKRHEHVPGIMLMEIARQSFYAHFYRFSEHTRESVNLSILEFNCEFVDYINSSHTLSISVETLSLAVEGTLREKHQLRATFRQRGKVVSVIEMVGTVVGARLFKKFRSFKPSADDMFSLIRKEEKVSILLLCDGGVYVEGWVDRLTIDTLIVKPTIPYGEINPNSDCKFHLFFEYCGIVRGVAVPIMGDVRVMKGELAVRITSFANGGEAKFREFIKMDCFHIERSGRELIYQNSDV